MATKNSWYSLAPILKYGALYNIIIGKRSNGKTFAVQEKIIHDYLKEGKQGGIIRRWEEDFRGRRGQATFQALVDKGVVKKLSNGEYDNIRYRSGKWFFSKYDEKLDKDVVSEVPFCYAFALTQAEHDKSTSYPKITNILFDEFITRQGYLPDEFILFTNTLSTIIRERDDVTIFMLGNTVNKYCPYFIDMGLTKVESQPQGTIEIYTYKLNEELKVAVEYCGEGKSKSTKLQSDKYFGFDNPKLQMITTGVWEIANYPHAPIHFDDKDVIYDYYLVFNNQQLRCKIVSKDDLLFTFIHRWTSEIPKDKIIFTTDYSPNPLHKRKVTKPSDKISKFIYYFFANDKIFYADNEVGEVVRNYLQWCLTDKGIR